MWTSSPPEPGDAVTVESKEGRTWSAIVSAIVRYDEARGLAILAFTKKGDDGEEPEVTYWGRDWDSRGAGGARRPSR